MALFLSFIFVSSNFPLSYLHSHLIDPRHSFLHLGVTRGIRNSKMKRHIKKYVGSLYYSRVEVCLGGPTRNVTPSFFRTHQTLKKYKKHTKKGVKKIVEYINIWNFNNVKKNWILMFLFITFTQSFRNVTMVIFLQLFG